jgi:hypothetical protein
VLEEPSEFHVETAKETYIDHIVIIVCAWRWKVRIVGPITLRTNPIGKTGKMVNQTRGHVTQL